MLKQMDDQVVKLRKELLQMCWYMRGGLSYEESIFLSREERTLISEIVKENLETTKNTKMPFF